jgi:hypothetical protein
LRLALGHIGIFYTPEIDGLIVYLAEIQALKEAIEISTHRNFFAVLSLSSDVNRTILGPYVRHRRNAKQAGEDRERG